jgi:hypothetical protein
MRDRLQGGLLPQGKGLYRAGQISFAELDASVSGWINHLHYGDTWGLRRQFFSPRLSRRTPLLTAIDRWLSGDFVNAPLAP